MSTVSDTRHHPFRKLGHNIFQINLIGPRPSAGPKNVVIFLLLWVTVAEGRLCIQYDKSVIYFSFQITEEHIRDIFSEIARSVIDPTKQSASVNTGTGSKQMVGLVIAVFLYQLDLECLHDMFMSHEVGSYRKCLTTHTIV